VDLPAVRGRAEPTYFQKISRSQFNALCGGLHLQRAPGEAAATGGPSRDGCVPPSDHGTVCGAVFVKSRGRNGKSGMGIRTGADVAGRRINARAVRVP
jgi:hypothetical protein